MRIFHLATGIKDADGVSNVILSVDSILCGMGYDSKIIVISNMIKSIVKNNIIIVRSFSEIQIGKDDIVFYHFCGANQLICDVELLECKKILFFHNISTPRLFRNVDWDYYKRLAIGVEEAKQTHLHFDYAVASSDYSKNNLIEYGWEEERVKVVPLISIDGFVLEADRKVKCDYKDGLRNFLFVGRVSPNKKIEDVIRVFGWYQKRISQNVRLFLVGNIQFQNYYEALLEYANYEGIENVVYTGSVSQEELEAYYEIADIFICMSEHEGLCIPILEAFQRNLPVVAYNATAIPNTMGEAGVLVDTKEPKGVCEIIKKIFNDEKYYNRIIRGQSERVQEFYSSNYIVGLEQIIKKTKGQTRDNNYKSFEEIVRNHSATIKSEAFDKPYIIYGYGNSGKKLLGMISDEQLLKLKSICDNNESIDTELIRHDECVKRYSDCNYIVTVQNGYISIIDNLIKDGILPEQIYHFVLSENRIRK